MIIGRSPIFNTAEEMQKRVDHYFRSISKTELQFESILEGFDDKEKPIYRQEPKLNDNNEQLKSIRWFETPTVCGLAEHLGMTRQTLNEYGKNEIFSDTVKRAKARVEKYLEEGLDGKDVVGKIFNLKNNFDWKDKTETEHSGSLGFKIVDDI